MFQRLAKLLFPPKCVLCRSLLPPGRTELCAGCAAKAPVCEKPTKSIPFVEKWTALWYYNDIIRRSFLKVIFHLYGTCGSTYLKARLFCILQCCPRALKIFSI